MTQKISKNGGNTKFFLESCTVRSKKKTSYLKFLYLPKLLADSDDIYEVYQAISQLFMGGKIFLEYSSFVEISAKN